MEAKESKKTYQIVIIRHGESLWNKENRFTGWHDVPLTEDGRKEARHAGRLLKEKGYSFDKCYTSVLTRAIHTLDLVLDEMGCAYLPVVKKWRLNERMYGGLTGMNKSECREQYGEEQVLLWRRSVNTSPPECELDSEYYPGNDSRYALVPKELLPKTEDLINCIDRVLPCWFDDICPDIISGKKLIISIHGNSIRALVKHLEGLTSEDSQREGQVATGSDAKDRRGGDESFCKSSKTQNRSLMEKLFHNLKELSADTSQETPKAHLSHKNKENVSFANGSRHLLSSNAGTNVDLKASERSFGQSIDLNGIQGMNTENREHFKDSLRVGSVQLPPRPTLTGREKISKGGNDRETISAREAFQKVESSYAMGISPAKKQTRSLITKVDFIDLQKPSSEFYSSNKESSLAQFTKYEEALQSELNNATTQNDFQSELDNGLYHSSQSQDQIKKLTIFGEPLPESSCDEDEDEQENLSGNKIKNDYFGHDQNEVDQPLGFNRTIKELSEAREDSGIYISSEDKRSLLRRLKENFEQNNAFDCVEFVVDTTNRKDNHDDSLDIDNRRVLFESEVRKQIHRNIPFEETEEYAKLELIHKLSKNKKSQDESKCSNRPSIHDQSMGRRRDDTLDLQVDDESDDQCQILNTSFSEQRFTASNKVSCRKPSNNGMISKNQSQDVSRSNNKSITLRSIGEKQLEELRNMFFDSSDPQEESKMEEVKEKATLLGKSRQKKSSKNIELSRISGMNLTSAVQKTGENPSASNASRSSGIQNSLQKKSAIIEEKQTREVKIPQRPMLAEASYSSSATLALQELTEYYLDQSREKSEMSRRMSKAENSMRIGLTPIGRDGGGSYQQNSTFFSGEEGNPFPSVTSMDGDQMLDNLTEVLKTDVKSKKQSQVVLIRAEQVEQMRRVIDMLESENKDLRQKFAKTPSGVPPRDRAKKPIKGKENSPVENVPAYEYSNEIRNFKDLADMAPRHSYSQIHMRRHLARHS